MMIEKVKLDGVLKVRLNRPEVKNALNPEMIQQLTTIFKEVGKDVDVRVVCLEGEGSTFCAGADLNWMRSLVGKDKKENLKDALELRELFQSLWECPVPVICLVQGAAFGGALGLMAASDYVIVDEKAQLCFSEVKLGIAPAVISEFVLRKSNASMIAGWMMSAAVFSAHEAYHAGLVHRVNKSGSLQDAASSFINSVLVAGPEAVRATKKLIRGLDQWPQNRIKEETTQLIAELRVSPEGQEGLNSFLEKRKPIWVKP